MKRSARPVRWAGSMRPRPSRSRKTRRWRLEGSTNSGLAFLGTPFIRVFAPVRRWLQPIEQVETIDINGGAHESHPCTLKVLKKAGAPRGAPPPADRNLGGIET